MNQDTIIAYQKGLCCLIYYKDNRVYPAKSSIYIDNTGRVYQDEHQLRAMVHFIVR